MERCIIPNDVTCRESIELFGRVVEFVTSYQKRFFRREGDGHSEIIDLRKFKWDNRPRMIDADDISRASRVEWVIGFYHETEPDKETGDPAWYNTEFVVCVHDEEFRGDYHYYITASPFEFCPTSDIDFKYAVKFLAKTRHGYWVGTNELPDQAKYANGYAWNVTLFYCSEFVDDENTIQVRNLIHDFAEGKTDEVNLEIHNCTSIVTVRDSNGHGYDLREVTSLIRKKKGDFSFITRGEKLKNDEIYAINLINGAYKLGEYCPFIGAVGGW